MADISKIKIPNGTTYNIKDDTARTNITNMKIGGRNLIVNSDFRLGRESWSDWGSPTTIGITTTVDNKNWLHCVTTSDNFQGYSQRRDLVTGFLDIEPSTEYTLSFTMYASADYSGNTCGIHWDRVEGSSTTIVTQNWCNTTLTTTPKRYAFTFTSGTDVNSCNVMVGKGGNSAVLEYWITDIKLEKGNKATDWCPALEDYYYEKIGGKNLMINTLNPGITDATRPTISGMLDADVRPLSTSTSITYSIAEHGIRSTAATAYVPRYIWGWYSGSNLTATTIGLTPGRTYTLSFDTTFKLLSGSPSTTTSYRFGAFFYSAPNTTASPTLVDRYTIHNYDKDNRADRGGVLTGRCEFTFTVPSDAQHCTMFVTLNDTSQGGVCASGDYIEMRNMMLQEGTKATRWSPAPEDIVMLAPNDNLLRRTQDFATWSMDAGLTLEKDPTEDGIIMVHYPSVSSVSYRNINNSPQNLVIPYSIIRNKTITFSYWIKVATASEVANIGYITFCLLEEPGGSRVRYSPNQVHSNDFAITSGWQKIKFTTTVTDSIFSNGSATITDSLYFCIQFYNHSTSESWMKKPKLEFGSVCTEWCKNSSDDIPGGGRNLLLNSKLSITNSTTYNIANIYFGDEKPIAGEPYVLQIKGTLGADRTGWGVYNSGGTVHEGIYNSSHGGAPPAYCNPTTGIYSIVIPSWKIVQGSTTATNTYLSLYQFPNGATSSSSIEWVKLEKGTVPTDWTPAPEDDTLNMRTLTDATLDNQSGTFAFAGSSGSNGVFPGTDWVGMQIGNSVDKFQIVRDSTMIKYRYNDSGGTNSANWSNWLNLRDDRYVSLIADGISLAANADLNSINTIGNYYCNTSSNTTTMSNLPPGLTVAFTMKVGYATGTAYLYQEVTRYTDGHKWYRVTSSGSFGAWVDLPSSGVLVGSRNYYIERDSSPGYITTSSVTSLTSPNATRKETSSDFIAVTPGEYINMQVWGTPTSGEQLWLAYAFCQSDKSTMVGSRAAKYATADYTYISYEDVLAPANAAYIRVSARMYSDGKMMIEKGNTVSDYKPAYEDVVNNVKIGGRNLILNSDFSQGTTNWANWGSPPTREIVTISGKKWLHVITDSTRYQGYSQNRNGVTGLLDIEPNTEYTLSFTMYSAAAYSGDTCGIHWNNSSGTIVSQTWCNASVTTTAQRFSYTFTSGSGVSTCNVMVGRSNGTTMEYWLTDVKLEKGNKATDWTPAPEDDTIKINTLTTNVGTLTTNVGTLTTNLNNFQTSVKADPKDDNLLFDTYATSLTKVNGPSNRYFSDSGNSGTTGTFVTATDLPDPKATCLVRLSNSSGQGVRALCFYGSHNPPLIDGHYYSMSCYARSTSGTPTLRLRFSANTANNKDFTPTSTWQKYEYTAKFVDSGDTSTTYKRTYFYFRPTAVGQTMEMCGFYLRDVTGEIKESTVINENLIPRTKDFAAWEKTTTTTIEKDATEDVNVFHFPAVSSVSYRSVSWNQPGLKVPYSWIRNKTVTLSFWIKVATASAVPDVGYTVFCLTSSPGTGRLRYTGNQVPSYVLKSTTDWQKVVFTTTITDSMFSNGSDTITEDMCFFIQFYNHSTSESWFKKPKLEIGCVDTEWCKNSSDDIPGDGRNLLTSSKVAITNSTTYNIAVLYFGNERPIAGEPYVLQIKGSLGSDRTGWGVYNSGGTVYEGNYNADNKGASPAFYNSATGIYTIVIPSWKIVQGSTTATNNRIALYQHPQSGASSSSSIEWVKLERGTVPTGWEYAPEDFNETFISDKIRLHDEMVVYKNSSSYESSNAGGKIGYGSGSMGDTTTNGIKVSNVSGSCYLIATDAGVRMSASDTNKVDVYVTSTSPVMRNTANKYVAVYNDDSAAMDGPILANKNTVLSVHHGTFVNIGSTSTSLGSSNYKWSAVYASTGTIQTSDRNQKYDINYDIDKYADIFDYLKPASYKLIDGQSGRIHLGMIAQDVEESMKELGIDSQDFAAFIKERVDGEDIYGLRYEEFIPILITKIKQQQTQIDSLQGEITALKQAIEIT